MPARLRRPGAVAPMPPAGPRPVLGSAGPARSKRLSCATWPGAVATVPRAARYPGEDARTAYVPGASAGVVNAPRASDVSDATRLPAASVTLTCAPTIGPPAASTTAPPIVAPNGCRATSARLAWAPATTLTTSAAVYSALARTV